MRVLLSGHSTCLNRGCEALVRTLVRDIGELTADACFLLPTATPAHDARVLSDLAWPVRTVPRRYSLAERALRRAQQRRWPGATRWAWPAPARARWRHWLRDRDLVLSTGGDTYSLDYGVPTSLLALDQCAVRRGVPVLLWGASVGPFDSHPALEQLMARGLRRYALIGARESETRDYLVQQLGLTNVAAMVDPAFALESEPLPATVPRPPSGAETIGLNLSNLIIRYGVPEDCFRDQAVRLIRALVARPDRYLYLIPHVAHPPETGKPSDHDLLAALLAAARLADAEAARVILLPGDLPAGQYRSAAGRCDLLVAARTHLTIAGYSQGVPTLSLGYSRKARGLATDIYGGSDACLPVAEFTAEAVFERMDAVRGRGEELRARALDYTRRGLETNRQLLREVLTSTGGEVRA